MSDSTAPAALESPLHRLVLSWWKLDSGAPRLSVGLFREALFEAALATIRLPRPNRRLYDPNADYRFQWACQWLEVAEGDRPAVDVSVHNVASFLFDRSRPLCGKEADEREPLTLALG
jgi:hypothetical protein